MKIHQLSPQDIELFHTTRNADLAERFGVSGVTIVRWRKKLNIPGKVGRWDSPQPYLDREERTCVCGNTFTVIITSSQESCSRECGYELAKTKIAEKAKQRWSNPTDEMINGIEKRRKRDIKEYRSYSSRVHNLTKKTYEKYKDEINPNNHPRTLCGVEGGYQLDHIIPIRYGFDNGIPEHVIADANNLRMLPWRINLLRHYGKT